MAKTTKTRQKIQVKGIIIPKMGRRLPSWVKFSAFLLAAVGFSLAPGLKAQSQNPAISSGDPTPGESCLYVKQQRKGICKKSSETCTEVHRLEALNLIKNCAQLAQECDLLGEKEDVSCQPGGNGRVTTLHH